jgi:hypothetical protein
MAEATLKDWEFVKSEKHDLSSLKNNLDPSDYLFQFNNGIYYPAVRLFDIPYDSKLSEKYRKKC